LKAREIKMGANAKRVNWNRVSPICTSLHTLHTH